MKKHEKHYESTIGKSKFFYGPKPLNNIEKHLLFLILGHSKKMMRNDAERDLANHVLGAKMATLASHAGLIL